MTCLKIPINPELSTIGKLLIRKVNVVLYDQPIAYGIKYLIEIDVKVSIVCTSTMLADLTNTMPGNRKLY